MSLHIGTVTNCSVVHQRKPPKVEVCNHVIGTTVGSRIPPPGGLTSTQGDLLLYLVPPSPPPQQCTSAQCLNYNEYII